MGVGELAFNLRPIHERLELPAETWTQAVSRWQREDKQLETLLQRWKEQERDETRPALLKRSLEGLRPEGRMLQYFKYRFRTPRACEMCKILQFSDDIFIPSHHSTITCINSLNV